MSSDRQSGVRSSETEMEATTELAASHADGPTPREFELSLPTLVKARGATLLDALELHLPGSGEHADGTATYAFAAAVELGFEREHAEGIRETARLHEIGKVYVPASVVSSDPNELDPQSRALLDSHPSYGAELARGAAIPSQACDWIAATSERFDGGGPAGLAGESIPIEARVIRVACACDSALGAPRAADSPEGPHGTAVAAMRDMAGHELDRRVVEALIVILDRAAAGT